MIFNIPVIKKEKNVLYNQVSLINAQIPVSYYIINENNEQQIIFLKEVDGERTFPIVIGIFEIIAGLQLRKTGNEVRTAVDEALGSR